MKIKEVIVVEGQHDCDRLKQFFDCDCIQTHGLHLSFETLDLIKQAHHKRGVILFMDDDSSGRKIRDRILQVVGPCKQAFIDKSKSRTKHKVGVEHASYEDLKESLERVVTLVKAGSTLSWEDFVDLGFLGPQGTRLRAKVLAHYHLPTMNNKRLFRYLTMMNVTKEEVAHVTN